MTNDCGAYVSFVSEAQGMAETLSYIMNFNALKKYVLQCNLDQPLTISDCVLTSFSIEFDRDCDYFAIAGVTKKIKVFEYGTVIQDAVDIHYPVNEMTCNSKIR